MTIGEILDNKKTVTLGYEPGTRKVHFLFYSVVDDAYFIAVQDERAREVVTVLPLEFGACRTSFYPSVKFRSLKQRAKDMIIGAPEIKGNADTSNKSIFFILYFRNILNKKLRAQGIWVNQSDYPNAEVRLEDDSRVHVMLHRLAQTNCKENEQFEDIFFGTKQKGKRERFTLK